MIYKLIAIIMTTSLLYARVDLAWIGDENLIGVGLDPKSLLLSDQDLWQYTQEPTPLSLPQVPYLRILKKHPLEFSSPHQHVLGMYTDYFVDLFLSQPSHGLAARLATAHSVPLASTIVVSKFQANMRDLPGLIARFLRDYGHNLPSQIIILLSGYDACTVDYHDILSQKDYELRLKSSIEALLSAAQTGHKKINIDVWAPFSLAQLVSNPLISKKMIKVSDQVNPITCQALNSINTVASSQHRLLFASRTYCSSLMAIPDRARVEVGLQLFESDLTFQTRIQKKQDEILAFIASRIRGHKKAYDYLKRIEDTPRTKVSLHDSLFDLRFTGEDIADDCLHFSETGQNKIFNLMSTGI